MILDIDSICGAIDNNLAELIHTVITIIKYGIPILLIIFGMLDIAKGVIASKEDETKKGQQMFIKRLISAVLVFFVITIVQLVIGIVDDQNDSGESDVWNCANLILNGKNFYAPKNDFDSEEFNRLNTIKLTCDYNEENETKLQIKKNFINELENITQTYSCAIEK